MSIDQPIDTDVVQNPSAPQDVSELAAELDELDARVRSLRAQLAGRIDGSPIQPARTAPATVPPARPPAHGPTSRRTLLTAAGASAAGAVAAIAVGGGSRAAAADPNDVVKNVPNPVSDTTTLNGAFPGPVLSLFNTSGASNAASLYLYSQSPAPTVRADNDEAGGIGGVALAGNAPGGRDVLARGSGRIAMESHDFGGTNEYQAGEIHQQDGTLYAMVTPTVRRTVAGPTAAGALHPIEPSRVYDSRLAQPFFGQIFAGQSRVVDINDRRDAVTGEVDLAGVVPDDATAVVYNLTIAATEGVGFLSVTPGATTATGSSTINWWGPGQRLANTSLVGLGPTGNIRVHCGGTGSTHFIVDIVGYHR